MREPHFAPVQIRNNGYIMLGRFCWHRESRLGQGWFGDLAERPVTYDTVEAAAKQMQGDEGAVIEFRGPTAQAIHLNPACREKQEERLNYWPSCYGKYIRKVLSVNQG